MKHVLVDSSIWIDYFRNGAHSSTLDSLLSDNSIVICGLILAELIPFLAAKKEKELIELLREIPRYDLAINWERIIEYQQICIINGVNRVGIPDLIILDTVLENNLHLLTNDKHFNQIQKYIPFEQVILDKTT